MPAPLVPRLLQSPGSHVLGCHEPPHSCPACVAPQPGAAPGRLAGLSLVPPLPRAPPDDAAPRSARPRGLRHSRFTWSSWHSPVPVPACAILPSTPFRLSPAGPRTPRAAGSVVLRGAPAWVAGRARDTEPLSPRTPKCHVGVEPSRSCEGDAGHSPRFLPRPLAQHPAWLLTAPCHSAGLPLPTRTAPCLSSSLGGAETALFVVFCVKCTLCDL